MARVIEYPHNDYLVSVDLNRERASEASVALERRYLELIEAYRGARVNDSLFAMRAQHSAQ